MGPIIYPQHFPRDRRSALGASLHGFFRPKPLRCVFVTVAGASGLRSPKRFLTPDPFAVVELVDADAPGAPSSSPAAAPPDGASLTLDRRLERFRTRVLRNTTQPQWRSSFILFALSLHRA